MIKVALAVFILGVVLIITSPEKDTFPKRDAAGKLV